MNQGLFDQAVRILSTRDHSVMEVRNKLLRKHPDQEEVEEVVQRCIALHYIDDARFTQIFIQSLMKKGKGETFIRSRLKERGIDENSIKSAFEHTEESQEDVAYRAARKKAATWSGYPLEEKKQKMLRFLLGRGFAFSITQTVIRHSEKWE